MKNTSFAMFFLALMTASCNPKETHLTILETTDTHGAYLEFANDASVLRQMKSEMGDHLILLDNGDNLQGTPYQYCSNRDAEHPNLVSATLNFFPYDVIGVGNHDVEAGKTVFDRFFSEVKMPVVCANVIDESTGKPYWQPYVIMKRDGFKIAETDLQLRGPGDLDGTLQSGQAFELHIANLSTDGQILERARQAAEEVLETDPLLESEWNRLYKRQLDVLRASGKSPVNWGEIS